MNSSGHEACGMMYGFLYSSEWIALHWYCEQEADSGLPSAYQRELLDNGMPESLHPSPGVNSP